METIKNISAYLLKGLLIVLVIFCFSFQDPSNNNKGHKPRPNVILILVDDMGFSDLGCYGSEIQTPNLDKLASEGLRMTQFYNTARCSPTRASLLTGLYPHQAGVSVLDQDLGTPEYQGYLNDKSVTMAEVLKMSGYGTYISGKWHVGKDKGHWPLDRGFDRYYGLINGASNFFNNIDYRDPEQSQTMLLDDQEIEIPATTEAMWEQNEGYYMTDAFTDYAIDFLDQSKNSDKPFFLYLAYTAPHWPLHAFPEDIAKYEGKYSIGWDSLRRQRYEKQLELGIIDKKFPLAPRSPEVESWKEADEKEKKEFEQEMAIYAAMIDRMDRNIGRVVQKLEEINASENTIIIFLSDNGGCHTTPEFAHLNGAPGGPNSFPCYGFQGSTVSNVPFRKQKQYIHEGGIATPLIVWYPSLINGPQINTQQAHVIDIMPTLVNICKAQYPEVYNKNDIIPMQGESLLPVFKGEQLERSKPIFWEHVGNRGVRINPWKLVAAKPELQWELYNLEEDRTELNDLSKEFPEKKEELIKIYHQWADQNHVLPWKPDLSGTNR